MKFTKSIQKLDPIEKRTAWFKIIADYQSSGQSQTIYCKQRGIKKDHFAYYLGTWRKANANTIANTSFVPIEVVKPQPQTNWLLKIAPGVSLELSEGTPMQQLAELILNLRKSLCS